MKKPFNSLSIILSAALLAAGAAHAADPVKVEGVPVKPAKSVAAEKRSSDRTRQEVRQEARNANRIAPKPGGEVAAEAGKPTRADTDAMFAVSDKTRAGVRAEARHENRMLSRQVRDGSEGDDTGKNAVW